jgi:hypothetical protein
MLGSKSLGTLTHSFSGKNTGPVTTMQPIVWLPTASGTRDLRSLSIRSRSVAKSGAPLATSKHSRASQAGRME